MLAPEGPGLVGASSVGPFAVKQRSLADPDGQFIFFAEGDIRRDVHVEGQEDAEVATGGPAIDEDLRVSCYGFEMRSEERRVGKSVDLGGRRIIKKKKQEELA